MMWASQRRITLVLLLLLLRGLWLVLVGEDYWKVMVLSVDGIRSSSREFKVGLLTVVYHGSSRKLALVPGN